MNFPDLRPIEKKVTATEVDEFAINQSLQLPLEYRDFLVRSNGGKPNAKVRLVELSSGRPLTSIRYFFALSTVNYFSLEWHYDSYRGRIPSGLLPIAVDSGGNLICLALSGEAAGAVYFWDHESEGSQGKLPLVTKSFGELLQLFGG
jgi:hypothetical protein